MQCAVQKRSLHSQAGDLDAPVGFVTFQCSLQHELRYHPPCLRFKHSIIIDETRKRVFGFPTTNGSLIPTVCPTIQFSAGTDYLEFTLTPEVKDSVPKTASTSDASRREGPSTTCTSP